MAIQFYLISDFWYFTPFGAFRGRSLGGKSSAHVCERGVLRLKALKGDNVKLYGWA